MCYPHGLIKTWRSGKAFAPGLTKSQWVRKPTGVAAPTWQRRWARYSDAMKNLDTLCELAGLVGQDVASSDWLTITQSQVNLFAQATGDHQWIHTDPEKARAGPFGAPIAHGFLTLSLLPQFFASAFKVNEARMGVNYGLNKVRFMSPVPVGSQLRAHLKLLQAAPIEPAGMQLTWQVTIECQGVEKPSCIAESVVRLFR